MRASLASAGAGAGGGPPRRAGALALALLLVLGATMWPDTAHAGKGERVYWAALAGDDGLRLGAGLGASLWITDLLAVGAAGDGLFDVASDGGGRVGARGEVRVALDALTWTPWLTLALGYGHGLGDADADAATGLALRFGAGVSFRPARGASLQLRLEWQAIAREGGEQRLLALVGGALHRGGAATLDF